MNALDYSGYPDCRPEFIRAFEHLARLATKAGVEGGALTVHTPLIALSKADIIRLGLSLGLDYGLTLSCYDPVTDGRPCGHCDSCRLRAAGFAEAGATDPLIRPAALIRFAAESSTALAQPLRRQVFFIVVILTILVYVAIGYGARLTYNEHVRQLAAETATMAATVVVYVNRNLETADAVADTASRHPSMRALDPSAAGEVLVPLVSDGGLLHNAVMADAEGRPIAWARPPDPAVEGTLDTAWLKSVATTGKTLISPMLGKAGDSAHAIVLGYPIVSAGTVIGVLGLSVHLEALERVLASIPLPEGSVVTLTDANSVVVARSLDASAVRRPIGRAGRPRPQSFRRPFLGDPDRRGRHREGLRQFRGRARTVAGQRRHPHIGRDVPHLADLPAQFRDQHRDHRDDRGVDVDVRAALAAGVRSS